MEKSKSYRKPTPTEFMAKLGNTSEEVAKSLKKYVILRGRQHPLLTALYENCSMWPGIELLDNGTVTYKDIQIMDPHVPAPVRQFVKDYRAGRYPDL